MVDQGSGVGPVSSRGKEKGKVVTLDALIGSQKASVLNRDLQLVSGEHAIREKTPLRRGGTEG